MLLLRSARMSTSMNVLGSKLAACSVESEPVTGWFRDGCCRTDARDVGKHTVCAKVDDAFLDFTTSRGNDLRSVVAAGQHWCVCVERWKEAAAAGVAPAVKLEATNRAALLHVTLEQLRARSLDA
jgi:uncharacterized protein (DUF2237 family)